MSDREDLKQAKKELAELKAVLNDMMLERGSNADGLISAIEHPAVRAGGRFKAEQIELIPVDDEGVIDLAALDAMLTRHRNGGRRVFVSVMAANNETGAIQPLAEIARRVHDAQGIFHVDAVQIAGRYPFDIASSGADLISISSHKLGGPQGVGALIVREEGTRVSPLLRGGGQERGVRAGTENVAAIAGFGVAAENAALTVTEEVGRIAAAAKNAADYISTDWKMEFARPRPMPSCFQKAHRACRTRPALRCRGSRPKPR